MVTIFTLSDIFGRHGISDWFLWALLLPALLVPMWLDRRRQAQRRAETGADETPPQGLPCVPLSGEEKRVSLRVTLLSLAAAATSIGGVTLIAFGLEPGGKTGLTLAIAWCAASPSPCPATRSGHSDTGACRW